MSQVLILGPGLLRYVEDHFGRMASEPARVFIVDYRSASGGGNTDKATVVFRDPVQFEGEDLPAGAIREITAAYHDDEFGGTFLTYDLSQVPVAV